MYIFFTALLGAGYTRISLLRFNCSFMLPKLYTVCITFQRGWLILTRYEITRNYVYYWIPRHVKLHQLFAGVWCTVCKLGPWKQFLWPVQGWMKVQAYENPSPSLPSGKVRVHIPLPSCSWSSDENDMKWWYTFESFLICLSYSMRLIVCQM